MELLLGIVVGLIILVALVVVHELGHAIVAKRNGVKVLEFGVGFPPKAWTKKAKDSFLGKNVEFSLNWLPLGGFVRLQGEHDAADKPGDYGRASYWVKTKILLAGVLMNWLVAVVLFTGLALVGLPKILPNQFSVAGDTAVISNPLEVVLVEEGSPADKIGLQAGDQIVRFDGKEIKNTQLFSDATKAAKGTTVEVVYEREASTFTKIATLRSNNNDGGFLGVGTRDREEIQATWSAPIVGVGTTVQLTWETLRGLGQVLGDTVVGTAQKFFSFNADAQKEGDEKLNTVSQSVAGPVGILGVIFPQFTQAGLKPLILLSAIISLTLAVMNTLPIPALDGGRWFTMTIHRLMGKKLTKEREEKIQTIGFIVLMTLIILVTVADVGKFF